MLKSLLNGTALRGVVTFAADAANAQGMNTNLTHIVSQDPDNVFNFICKTLEIIHKSSVTLCCGIAQLFLVRTFHMDDAQRWKAERTRDFLKAQLNERGLKQAMVYRYIATGQEIARLIQKKYVWGGVMHEILAAETEQKAFNVIHRCVMAHDYLPANQKPTLDWLLDGDHKQRFSLDVLRVNLGLDKLEPSRQPGYVAPQPVTNASPGSNAPDTTIAAPATKANPASIVARVTADPDALKGVSIETMAGAVEKVIGRETMAERLISLCTVEECLKLQTVLNNRMLELANAKPEAVATDAPTETKTVPPVNEIEVPETTKGRARSRKRA